MEVSVVCRYRCCNIFPLQFSIAPPAIEAGFNDVQVPVNQSLEATCSATGIPTPDVVIKKKEDSGEYRVLEVSSLLSYWVDKYLFKVNGNGNTRGPCFVVFSVELE